MFDTSERELFQLIQEAAFTNPFTKKRKIIDERALNIFGRGNNKQAPLLTTLVTEVKNSLQRIESKKGFRASSLAKEDLDLLSYGYLFYIFHHFCEDYDQHIQAQIEEKNQCLRVDFAEEALSMLMKKGFSAVESERFFALFFQIRRAFYFISRIVGKSESMCTFRAQLWNTIFSRDISLYNMNLWNRMEDFSTLLLGETGVGKGMAAAAIGRSGYIPFIRKRGSFSENFVKAFTPINLCQYSKELIESELFGHQKGAFTGALEAHKGILARCSPCGSIFLDEIGEVDETIQIKLLKVLEDRFFSPVGSQKEERFSGRVIAATNKDINELRSCGEFRDDFYYRLCSNSITIPSLRERLLNTPDEIHHLLNVVIKRILGTKEEERINSMSKEIADYFQKSQPENYQWHGNIRELEQRARQYLLQGFCDWQQENLSNAEASQEEKLAAEIYKGNFTCKRLQQYYCNLLYQRLNTYEAVAKTTGLDRRTVKKQISEYQNSSLNIKKL